MKLHVFLLFGLIATSSVIGCGGSGSSGGGGVVPTPPGSIYPTLRSISPTVVQAGSPATTIVASGENFTNGVVVQWNGAALPTSCVDTTTMASEACGSANGLAAIIPASDLTVPGNAQVTVLDAPPEGKVSASLTFTVRAVPAEKTWVKTVLSPVDPNDEVWDPLHGKLYVALSSSSPASPNTIVPIDPVAGTAGTPVPAGTNPDLLAISSGSSYLWADIKGNSTLQRYLLPGMTKDISIPLGKNPAGVAQYAQSLQAAPVNPHTVALDLSDDSYPGSVGVFVYDDATQRPKSVPGLNAGPEIDAIQWGKDDSTIWGLNPYGPVPLKVTSSGVAVNGASGGLALDYQPSLYNAGTGLLYGTDQAVDPVLNSIVGQFDVPLGSTVCTADSSLGRYFCLVYYNPTGISIYQVELWVYDLHSYALLDRLYLGMLDSAAGNDYVSPITGSPWKLVRCGNSGLALITRNDTQEAGGVFLIDGQAINPNAAPDVSSGTEASPYPWMNSISPAAASVGSGDVTVEITGKNFTQNDSACWDCSFLQFNTLPTNYDSQTQLTVTIPASVLATVGAVDISIYNQATNSFSTNALSFTVLPASGATKVTPLNLAGLGMDWDAKSQLLYVGTADVDSSYPNSIVAIDGTSGTVAKAQTVSPNPDLLSVSAGGDYLYVAYASETNLNQLALPGLNLTASGVLKDSKGGLFGAFIAGDMKAAPQSPHTVAATLIMLDWQPQSLGGVVVFDDAVLRPDFAPGWGQGQTVTASYDTLAWSSSDQLLTSAPSSFDFARTGPLYQLQVNASGVTYLGEGAASFNASGGYIHSDFGTGLIYSDDGTVADPNTGSIAGSYNASGLAAPDSTLNRVFILGQTQAQANTNSFTIQSFDQKAYTLVSSITLKNLAGSPIQLVRWGTSGLAVLTTGGSAGAYESSKGTLYLIEDSTFVSNRAPAVSTKTLKPELVQQRWKQLSKMEILKLMHQVARSQ